MIGKVTRGGDVAGLLRYLYGPGKANEHTDAHLVASWLGDGDATLSALEPAPAPGRQRLAPLADRLSLPLRLLEDPPAKHVWQCSMRVAEGDRKLTEQEWATVAREVIERTGFARADDPGGCRWVAVRHAEDHIHIVVVLARQDGQPVNTYRDWPKVHAAARSLEQRLGLTTVPSPDHRARIAPTRAESEKAARVGRREPARAYLQQEVRFAAAASTSREHFEQLLRRRRDIVISWRASQRDAGQVTGYKIGRIGDLDAAGHQVWFPGSKLSPDLSFPRLQQRWMQLIGSGGPLDRRQIWRQADRAFERASRQPLDPHTALGISETAIVFARMMEGSTGGELTKVAIALSDAARRPRSTPAGSIMRAVECRQIACQLAELAAPARTELHEAARLVEHLQRLSRLLVPNSSAWKCVNEPTRPAMQVVAPSSSQVANARLTPLGPSRLR